ncbi:hypothetical protein Zm00014a_031830 [Zea mays]|uniref:Uncharacterized protein n=1 Tax=Zea mays TaxID=4577 RepID=A0A3L6EUS6_MAIZE|nr:hypothetical protein Zm00014a_031830 [Zea mays]
MTTHCTPQGPTPAGSRPAAGAEACASSSPSCSQSDHHSSIATAAAAASLRCGARVYNGCQSWETILTVYAFCSTNLIDEFGPTIERAHEYIKRSQVLKDQPNYQSYYRQRSKGSWTLSTVDSTWNSPDITAEALKVLMLLSKISPNLVGNPIEEQKLYDAVDCILYSMV